MLSHCNGGTLEKNRIILYLFEDPSPSQSESDCPSWAPAFPPSATNPVMILSLMLMMMMTLTDGYINRLCRQNAEFSVVNLAVNISEGWSINMVMVWNFEVTVWTGGRCSLDRVSSQFILWNRWKNTKCLHILEMRVRVLSTLCLCAVTHSLPDGRVICESLCALECKTQKPNGRHLRAIFTSLRPHTLAENTASCQLLPVERRLSDFLI